MKVRYAAEAKYRVVAREYPEEFLEALDDMQGGNYDGADLLRYLKANPEFAKGLEKGMEYPTLYRGFGLGLEGMKRFFKSGRLPEMKNRIESWAVTRDHSKGYLVYHNCPGSYAILFKKKVPEEKRLLFTKGIPSEQGKREIEVVCLPQVLTKDDIDVIYFVRNTKGKDHSYRMKIEDLEAEKISWDDVPSTFEESASLREGEGWKQLHCG